MRMLAEAVLVLGVLVTVNARASELPRMKLFSSPQHVVTVEGDLFDQDVDVIVNAWNRSIIPWWLLLPQGISGAMKRRAGLEPFHELARHGPIPLGGAVLTSAGALPYKGIIHVAGINLFWRASEWSIRQSVKNALTIATENRFRSIALPLIGAGSGGMNASRAKRYILDQLGRDATSIHKRLVILKQPKRGRNF